MKYTVTIGDRKFRVAISDEEGRMTVDSDGQQLPVELRRIGSSNIYSFLFGNSSFDFEVSKNEGGYTVVFEGRVFKCELEDERLSAIRTALGAAEKPVGVKELRSPMPGLVLAIKAKEGDRVRSGEGLVVVEAMKMENELRAPRDATIKEIQVKERQYVERDQVLVVFE